MRVPFSEYIMMSVRVPVSEEQLKSVRVRVLVSGEQLKSVRVPVSEYMMECEGEMLLILLLLLWLSRRCCV